jgi:hypothetical protein
MPRSRHGGRGFSTGCRPETDALNLESVGSYRVFGAASHKQIWKCRHVSELEKQTHYPKWERGEFGLLRALILNEL